jgi:hypothetical protein
LCAYTFLAHGIMNHVTTEDWWAWMKSLRKIQSHARAASSRNHPYRFEPCATYKQSSLGFEGTPFGYKPTDRCSSPGSTV